MPVLGFLQRMRLLDVALRLRHLGQLLVVFVEDPELLLGKVFDVDEKVARPFDRGHELVELELNGQAVLVLRPLDQEDHQEGDRKSTRLNSSHGYISYAVFCLKKKT